MLTLIINEIQIGILIKEKTLHLTKIQVITSSFP